MPEEAKYRQLLERAQEANEHIESFLAAISDAHHGDSPEIKSIVVKSRQHLQDVQDGINRLWDVFKRLR